MVTVLWSSMTNAMLTMPPRISMERICKEAGSGLNLPVIPGIAEIIEMVAAEMVAAAEMAAEMVEEALEAAEMAEVVDAVAVVLEATHLDPGPITDWLWKTCLHVLHGRT